MPPVEKSNPTKEHWRSPAELADAPEFRAFMEAEFPAGTDPGGMSRRRWLQIMGASVALAGVGGCRWEKEEIRPFAERPEGRTPGVPQRYATAMDLGGSALGLLVTSHDGRPIKIEGNPKHPASLGATDALAQAAILGLYDPDRSANVVRKSGGQEIVHESWAKFDEFAREHFPGLKNGGGETFRVLAEASSSPTLAALRAKLLETFPKARWYEYEPVSDDNARAGALAAFGRPVQTHVDLSEARVIVCLDADLLGLGPMAVRHARDFAKGRDPASGQMNRLYCVESGFSLTGAAADHRLALPSAAVAPFVESLGGELRFLVEHPDETPEQRARRHRAAATQAAGGDVFLHAVAGDLIAHRGQACVAAGPAQPAAVHAAVHRINVLLGNVGKPISYTADPARPSHLEAIRGLVADATAGQVDTLLILGGNPVYNAPADLELATVLDEIETSIHLSLYRDETSRRCTWHLPRAHFLESWGDARAHDGTYGVVQPLIAPLWGGRSAIEVLALVAGVEPAKPLELVRASFDAIAGPNASDKAWRRTIHDGLLPGSRRPAESPTLVAESKPPAEPQSDKLSSSEFGSAVAGVERSEPPVCRISGGSLRSTPATPASHATNLERLKLEIVFRGDASVCDGRFANNGWLQEMPDPMTRLTWDNAAVMSPATAEGLEVEHGDVVKLKLRERELEMPVMVLPGVARGSVSVALGYGRTAAGRVGGSEIDGIAPVGANAYTLRTSEAMDFDTGLSVEPTGRKYPLATTQDHWAIDAVGMKERGKRVGKLVRDVSLARYEHYSELSEEHKKHEDITGEAIHHPPLVSLWKEPSFKGEHRWGMSIDLSKCIGCNACVVACQAENNVPIVGKEQVLKGREMHWIRIDRYFQGEPDAPDLKAVHQPLACQHCEMAPCEQVCPVAATVHSKEGLNDMVYNRCVGTRYCANNCPYKVRRFNYFNYHKDLEDAANAVARLKYNPEVTVRSRGVMEKCTYCVQRIQDVKIGAKNQRRPVADGEIKTACQQACPARAIEFGDLGDPKSRVRRAQSDDRAYGLLAELNVKPRTAYLARVRNPNPELESGSATTGRGFTQLIESNV